MYLRETAGPRIGILICPAQDICWGGAHSEKCFQVGENPGAYRAGEQVSDNGECLKTAAAHSPNKDDSIFPFLSMRFFQKVELHKSFPRSITPPLKPCQANFATSFCTAAFKSCPVLHFLSIKLSSGPGLTEIYEDFEMHCISLLKL